MPIHIRELVLTIAVTQPPSDAVQRLPGLGGVAPAAEALSPLPEDHDGAQQPSDTGHQQPATEGSPQRSAIQANTVAKVADMVYRLLKDEVRLDRSRL